MNRLAATAVAGWLALPLLLSAQPAGDDDKPPARVRVEVYSYREPSRYWGYGPRTIYDGMADLTRAQGDYWKKIQEAAQERERTRRMRVETDKQRLKALAWARDFQVEQWEKEEKRARDRALRTSQQEDTPLPLVLDGSALNILTTHLGTLSIPPGTSSTKIPNARQVLAGINFTGTSGGHVGLLRQERTLWPALLLEDEFADRRGRVEELLKDGRTLAAKGDPAAGVLKDLLGQIDGLRARVEVMSRSAGDNPLNSPGQQIVAYRFLNDLKRTANVLADPAEAKRLLTQVVQADDVAGLVQHLRANGLRFGPSTADNRQYYLILHKAMAEESRRRSPSAP